MTDTSTDVTEIRETTLNISNLEKYLINNISQFEGPISIKQFGHGQSNPTFLVTDQTTSIQYVMRKRPPGKIVSKTAHRVDREYKVMDALYSTNVPVPKMYVLCTDESVIGSMFYIMEFKKGRIFKAPDLLELPKQDRRDIWLALIDVLAKLHNVDFRQVGLEKFSRSIGGYFKRQLNSLSNVSKAQLEVSPDVPEIPEFHTLVQILNDNSPKDNVSIVHGDFKMDNCIFHPTEPKIIAVIDWEMSTIGHYGGDLGNSLSPFFMPEDRPPVFGPTLAPSRCIELGLPSINEILNLYCNRRSPVLDLMQLKSEMYYYVGFFCWKNSIITQGIAARVAIGQASSAQANMVGQLTPILGELSKYMLDKFMTNGSSKL